MAEKMRNILEKRKNTETPEQTIEKAQEQLAKEKFEKLVTLANRHSNIVNYSTREPGALALSITADYDYSDINKNLIGYKRPEIIEYTKIIESEGKKLQISDRKLIAKLTSINNGKEYRYVSYVLPNINRNGLDVEEFFPGTHNGEVAVVISIEKAIKIMDRMIKEIEAAKKCEPINKSKELLSELKQDVGEVETKAV